MTLNEQYPTFPTTEGFYLARGGARSGESDYGVWWRDEQHRTWRVTVVHDTGDVYAERLMSAEADVPKVIVFGTLPHACDYNGTGYGPNRKHGHSCAYVVGERVLDTWTDHIHDKASLQWVREKLLDHPPAESFGGAEVPA